MGSDSERAGRRLVGAEGVEGSSKKEKGLMGMDSTVVTVGERGYKRTKW